MHQNQPNDKRIGRDKQQLSSSSAVLQSQRRHYRRRLSAVVAIAGIVLLSGCSRFTSTESEVRRAPEPVEEVGNAVPAPPASAEPSSRVTSTTVTERQAPTTKPSSTEEPRVSKSSDIPQVGDKFEDVCTVAWPSAPIHSHQGTQITATCRGIDQSVFQFVDILIPGPDLGISPSRSTVRVKGQVIDEAESEMGFKSLVVIADKASLI